MDMGGGEEGFPEDLWAIVGANEDRPARLRRAERSLDEIETLYGAQRDPALVAAFIATHVPAGRLLVYGAGLHTPPVLEMLRRRGCNDIVGIVDRMADQVRRFEGCDVFTPQETVGLSYDYILLSHGTYEDEMVEALRSVGVPSERIIPIYAHPAFHDLARRAAAVHARRFSGRSIETLIISCAPMAVTSDESLATIFSPDKTLHLYFGRNYDFSHSELFETVDVHESLYNIAEIIRAVNPNVIYARSIIYKNYLAYWLKQRFPYLKVIQELYDHSIIWRDHDLERLYGLTPRTIARLRLSEYAAAQVCDLVVSKRGGSCWTSIEAGGAAPYRLYYPMARDCAVNLPADPAGIVYAGFLPMPSLRTHFKNGYDFVTVMEEVCRRRGWVGEIYNVSHGGPDVDHVYASYMEAYRGDPLLYRRRVPYGALLREMPRFAYGWLCDKVHEFQADRYVGVCNRWSGYVSAGLPVLIDAGWRLMADLVRDYDAGLVVATADADQISRAMAGADHDALRRGNKALLNHLLRHNAGTLQAIAEAAGK